MPNLFVWFWTLMILTSIGWYFVLIFYVGAKGGAEIRHLIRSRQQGQAGAAEGPVAQAE